MGDPLRQGRREEIDIVLAVNIKGVHLWAEIVRVLFSSRDNSGVWASLRAEKFVVSRGISPLLLFVYYLPSQ